MSDTQIAEIADKLTAAQIAAMINQPSWIDYQAAMPCSCATAKVLLKYALVEGVACRGCVAMPLTPLGTAVAAYLKEQSGHE